MNKLRVGILGATGMVGQNYIHLLREHPWFDITYLAASPNSAGKKYFDAVNGKWQMDLPIPNNIKDIIVSDANVVSDAINKVDFVFSALDLDKDKIKDLENEYAKVNIPVISNASANRWIDDVPMIIPEINYEHVKLIEQQKINRGWKKGFIVVKPNCSIQSYLTPIYALMCAGYEIKKIMITTMQAVSGAGYPGVASLDIIDNIIPFISGEEEKTEKEPLKVLGELNNGKIKLNNELEISANCNRVPVIDGHTACVNVLFGNKKPTIEGIKTIWKNFKSLPQEQNLPFAPTQPIIYIDEQNRPQPRKDKNLDKGMAVCVGRLRPCNIFDVKFVGLSHNTIRGAAGGGILNAELLRLKGYL